MQKQIFKKMENLKDNKNYQKTKATNEI